ncbi:MULTISPECIES: type VI secretion system protein TssL, short form [unclassified Pseudomonas]|uniref:type VI secretion system protein TssL, short form n=1 Tax=unclassified Pseudomonas TaxID=196821 RepID=UPI0030DB2616
MNLITSKKHNATTVDIDDLLQGTYLLVVELRRGASVPDSEALGDLCVTQVEQVRQRLEQAGLSPRSVDHINHAQCALLDETVLTCTQGTERTDWAREPLQARFFNRHQAGEFLYEDMREVLREAAPDQAVLTAFQRILTLGFRGRYQDIADPEREQILAALNAQVMPLAFNPGPTTQVAGSELIERLRQLRSPLVHALAVVLLFAGVWWAMDHLLNGVIASLLPDQA